MIVGALSVGQVPAGVVRDLCKATKPGWLDAVTTAIYQYLLKIQQLNFIHLTTPLHCFLFPLGGYICMTTRSNHDNLEYKADLEHEMKQMEAEGLWSCVEVTEAEDWERAVSAQEDGYISGVVYLYKKL